MWDSWKNDIKRAIWLVVVVAIAGILINWVRTPLLVASARQGNMTNATAYKLSGVPLIDDWEHKGWPQVAQVDEENGEEDENGEGNGDEENGLPPDVEPQIWPVDIYTIKEFFDEGDCTFYDARDPEYYEEGHITGAIIWPSDDFDINYLTFTEEMARGDCIVIYCSGGSCDESYHLAQSLVLEGFYQVYLFEGGMEEWELYGYPVTTGTESSESD